MTTDARYRAWDAIHEALPDGWAVASGPLRAGSTKAPLGYQRGIEGGGVGAGG